ncbi:MAG: hypothetical protein BGP06_09400 [Rhizobiales bacterium 65-9]|nr:hypothetical protein [Hyphomicrobiales bacterium]OJY38673.1 MAG: hypothetical protein BGP06_09400 [Rhizobiales bacterium 65-9]
MFIRSYTFAILAVAHLGSTAAIAQTAANDVESELRDKAVELLREALRCSLPKIRGEADVSHHINQYSGDARVFAINERALVMVFAGPSSEALEDGMTVSAPYAQIGRVTAKGRTVNLTCKNGKSCFRVQDQVGDDTPIASTKMDLCDAKTAENAVLALSVLVGAPAVNRAKR